MIIYEPAYPRTRITPVSSVVFLDRRINMRWSYRKSLMYLYKSLFLINKLSLAGVFSLRWRLVYIWRFAECVCFIYNGGLCSLWYGILSRNDFKYMCSELTLMCTETTLYRNDREPLAIEISVCLK